MSITLYEVVGTGKDSVKCPSDRCYFGTRCHWSHRESNICPMGSNCISSVCTDHHPKEYCLYRDRCINKRCQFRHPLRLVIDRQTRSALIAVVWKFQGTSIFGAYFIALCKESVSRIKGPMPVCFEMNRGNFSRSVNLVLKILYTPENFITVVESGDDAELHKSNYEKWYKSYYENTSNSLGYRQASDLNDYRIVWEDSSLKLVIDNRHIVPAMYGICPTETHMFGVNLPSATSMETIVCEFEKLKFKGYSIHICFGGKPDCNTLIQFSLDVDVYLQAVGTYLFLSDADMGHLHLKNWAVLESRGYRDDLWYSFYLAVTQLKADEVENVLQLNDSWLSRDNRKWEALFLVIDQLDICRVDDDVSNVVLKMLSSLLNVNDVCKAINVLFCSQTAFHRAAMYGNPAVVKLLLEKRSFPELSLLADVAGEPSPLILAAVTAVDHILSEKELRTRESTPLEVVRLLAGGLCSKPNVSDIHIVLNRVRVNIPLVTVSKQPKQLKHDLNLLVDAADALCKRTVPTEEEEHRSAVFKIILAEFLSDCNSVDRNIEVLEVMFAINDVYMTKLEIHLLKVYYLCRCFFPEDAWYSLIFEWLRRLLDGSPTKLKSDSIVYVIRLLSAIAFNIQHPMEDFVLGQLALWSGRVLSLRWFREIRQMKVSSGISVDVIISGVIPSGSNSELSFLGRDSNLNTIAHVAAYSFNELAALVVTDSKNFKDHAIVADVNAKQVKQIGAKEMIDYLFSRVLRGSGEKKTKADTKFNDILVKKIHKDVRRLFVCTSLEYSKNKDGFMPQQLFRGPVEGYISWFPRQCEKDENGEWSKENWHDAYMEIIHAFQNKGQFDTGIKPGDFYEARDAAFLAFRDESQVFETDFLTSTSLLSATDALTSIPVVPTLEDLKDLNPSIPINFKLPGPPLKSSGTISNDKPELRRKLKFLFSDLFFLLDESQSIRDPAPGFSFIKLSDVLNMEDPFELKSGKMGDIQELRDAGVNPINVLPLIKQILVTNSAVSPQIVDVECNPKNGHFGFRRIYQNSVGEKLPLSVPCVPRKWLYSNVTPQSSDVITVMSFNIQSETFISDNDVAQADFRYAGLRSVLLQVRPDIVCFQEIRINEPNFNGIRIETLVEFFKEGIPSLRCFGFKYEHMKSSMQGSDPVGLAIFWNPDRFTATSTPTVNFNDRIIMQGLESKASSQKLYMICAHLKSGADKRDEREGQAKLLLNKVSELSLLDKNSSIVMCGDFNAEPIEKCVSLITEDNFVSVYQKLKCEKPTHKIPTRTLTVDYIFARDCEILNALELPVDRPGFFENRQTLSSSCPSDHWPIAARLRLGQPVT